MDIARPDIARAKKIRRIVYATGFAVVILLITVGVSRLEPAAPRVDKDTVYMDTVERGEMLRNVPLDFLFGWRLYHSRGPRASQWHPAASTVQNSSS